jgi:hypothetical protein
LAYEKNGAQVVAFDQRFFADAVQSHFPIHLRYGVHGRVQERGQHRISVVEGN